VKPRKWTETQLREAAKSSFSVRQVLNKLGLREAGGNYSQIKKYLDEFQINTEHFKGKGWNKGLKGIGISRIKLEDILVVGSTFQSYKLKKRLFSIGLKKPQCELCNWAIMSKDGRIPLELDHINGNRLDNRIENLRILCPNCHSLQPTHRGRNIRKLRIS
jgi:hypothetical protein